MKIVNTFFKFNYLNSRVVSALFMVFLFFYGNTLVFAQTSQPSALYTQARKVYSRLVNAHEKRPARDEWLLCIGKFNGIDLAYPTTQEAYKAVYTVARIYHQIYKEFGRVEDQESALHYYKKVVDNQGFKYLGDDALYHEGEIHLERKNFSSANEIFKTILEKYPDGDQTAKVKKVLNEIKPQLNKQRSSHGDFVGDGVILQKLSYFPGSNLSQVVIHTSSPVEISSKRLTDPDRFYLDFSGTRIDENLLKHQAQIKDEVIEQVRLSQHDKNTSRLVIDIKPVKGLDINTLRENGRVVVEIRRPLVSESVQTVKLDQKKDFAQEVDYQKLEEPHKSEVSSKVMAKPVTAISAPVINPLPTAPLVVLDPGHGGKDMGAQGDHGLLEKTVNLEVARRVEQILVNRYKYRVKLTREDDSFVSLKDRGSLANENGASVFVSIHTNAAPRKSAMGIETYFLGMGSNERARETAARENGELVKSVQDDQVQNILTDLLSTTKINASSRLAGRVQNHLASVAKKFDGAKNLGVKEGPFFVLHDTNMPSILVEMGFITNVIEEKRLDSSTYLNTLAFSIARGIHEFLRERDPLI
jgi:N-acetylmuramoyl-L-alanine amidase